MCFLICVIAKISVETLAGKIGLQPCLVRSIGLRGLLLRSELNRNQWMWDDFIVWCRYQKQPNPEFHLSYLAIDWADLSNFLLATKKDPTCHNSVCHDVMSQEQRRVLYESESGEFCTLHKGSSVFLLLRPLAPKGDRVAKEVVASFPTTKYWSRGFLIFCGRTKIVETTNLFIGCFPRQLAQINIFLGYNCDTVTHIRFSW
jgi:hypothetical protein